MKCERGRTDTKFELIKFCQQMSERGETLFMWTTCKSGQSSFSGKGKVCFLKIKGRSPFIESSLGYPLVHFCANEESQLYSSDWSKYHSPDWFELSVLIGLNCLFWLVVMKLLQIVHRDTNEDANYKVLNEQGRSRPTGKKMISRTPF